MRLCSRRHLFQQIISCCINLTLSTFKVSILCSFNVTKLISLYLVSTNIPRNTIYFQKLQYIIILKHCRFLCSLYISTVSPLYNDIRYNSKIRYNVNLVCTKISRSFIFSLMFPFYSSGQHTFCIFVRIASARRF